MLPPEGERKLDAMLQKGKCNPQVLPQDHKYKHAQTEAKHKPEALPPEGKCKYGTTPQDNSNKGGCEPSVVLHGKVAVMVRTSMSSEVFIVVVTHLKQEDEDISVMCTSGKGIKPTHHPSWPQ